MVVRKLRLADKQSNGRAGVVRVPGLREVKEILKKEASEVSDQEIRQLADSWEAIDKQAKELASVSKSIKSLLLEIARRNDCDLLMGDRYEAVVGDTVKAVVVGTPTDLARLLKREKRMELFDTVVGIKVGEAKKLLGTDLLEKGGIIKHEKQEKSRIVIRPIKEKG